MKIGCSHCLCFEQGEVFVILESKKDVIAICNLEENEVFKICVSK